MALADSIELLPELQSTRLEIALFFPYSVILGLLVGFMAGTLPTVELADGVVWGALGGSLFGAAYVSLVLILMR